MPPRKHPKHESAAAEPAVGGRTGPDTSSDGEPGRHEAATPDSTATLDSTATPEIRTHRLVICGSDGEERAVVEVVDGQVALRMATGPSPTEPGDGRRLGGSVVVFACPGSAGFGPMAGLQIWAEGNIVASFDAWSDSQGTWDAEVHTPGLRPVDRPAR